MLFSLGATFVNPMVAKAEEINVTNYNGQVYEEKTAKQGTDYFSEESVLNNDETMSELDKVSLKDLIILDDVVNVFDYNYLSNLYLINDNGTLILASEDKNNIYEIRAYVHNNLQDAIEIDDIDMTGIPFQLEPESVIEISFKNLDTQNQYKLLISLKSTVLDKLSDDLDVTMNSFVSEKFSDEKPEEIREATEVEESKESVEATDETEIEEVEETIDATEVEEPEEVKDEIKTEKSVEESTEVVVEKTGPMLKTFSLTTTNNSMVAKNGLYTVVAGDTLNNIANNFKVSLPQLKVYNNIPASNNNIVIGQVLAVSREGVENLLSNSEKAHLYTEGTNIFNSPEDFFDYIAPTAMQIANTAGEKKLYASVMIAQAAHETGYGTSGLSSIPYHNLSGIKGTYNGDYVKMWTGEFLKNYNNTGKNVYVYVLADFKKFPSYEVSLQSYANLLRYGTSWNKNLYSGTWFENTNSYLDATAELTKNYATDPSYTIAVNNMIQKYDLTKYDNNDVFLTKKTVDFYGTVLPSNNGIYTKPYGMSDSILYTNYKYNNKDVHITEEATTQSGTFFKLVNIKTRATLGWIRKADMRLYDTFITKQNVNYYATVDSNNNGIYTKPKGMYDSILYTSYKYNGKNVRITEEATTQTGTYAKLVDINTRATLGWLKKSDLAFYDSFLTKYSVNYTVTVLPNNDGIYTKPLGMQGAVLYTSYKYNNKEVKVGEKATTQSGTFLKLVDINTRATLGWIKEKDIK